MKKEVKELICGWILGIFVCALITMCSGCTTTKYITEPEIHNNYINRTDTVEKTDTVIRETTKIIQELDSAALADFGIKLDNQRKAFLVQINNLEKLVSKSRESHNDTIIKVDSIPYPVEVIKEKVVQREFTWYERMLICVGGLALFIIISVVLINICPWKRP